MERAFAQFFLRARGERRRLHGLDSRRFTVSAVVLHYPTTVRVEQNGRQYGCTGTGNAEIERPREFCSTAVVENASFESAVSVREPTVDCQSSGNQKTWTSLRVEYT